MFEELKFGEVNKNPIAVSTCTQGNMIVTIIICADGKIWRQMGSDSSWKQLFLPKP
jgi:hypothetical protein